MAEAIMHDEAAAEATPETRTKLRPDVVAKLHQAGSLRTEHVLAADEIRDMWHAFGRGMFPSRAMDGTEGCSGGGKTPRGPLERMTSAEYRTWRTVYRPWAEEMGGGVTPGSRLTVLGLVVELVVDNYGPRQLEDLYSLRHGTVTKVVADALFRYAEIAGFVLPEHGA